MYKHLSASVYYLNYFATYAGLMFITTWVFQFLKFEIIKELLGLEDINHLPFHGDIWGYTVLNEKQLLFRVVALSAMLVLSVIGNRSINAQEKETPLVINIEDTEGIQQMNEGVLYNATLRQKEEIFWSKTSTFWPIINFVATFFHIFVIVVVMWQALYWNLSWTMMLFIFFAIGPWYSLDLNFLQTKNIGDEQSLISSTYTGVGDASPTLRHTTLRRTNQLGTALPLPLLHYSNIAVRALRYKKWRMLTWLCILSWIIIFPSHKLLQLLSIKSRTKAIFYGEWAGLLYPGTNPSVKFWDYVSGYMVILFVLVIERKLLEWLESEDARAEVGQQDKDGQNEAYKIYNVLCEEIARRKEIKEGKKKDKKEKEPLVIFEGIDEENKMEIKQLIKQEINEVLNRSKKKKDRTKDPHKPYLKSALKKNQTESSRDFERKEEYKREEGPQGPRPFDEPENDFDQDRDADDSEFNLLFSEGDPKRKQNKKLLLFQYRIKFMRGAKLFSEEVITFSLLL